MRAICIVYALFVGFGLAGCATEVDQKSQQAEAAELLKSINHQTFQWNSIAHPELGQLTVSTLNLVAKSQISEKHPESYLVTLKRTDTSAFPSVSFADDDIRSFAIVKELVPGRFCQTSGVKEIVRAKSQGTYGLDLSRTDRKNSICSGCLYLRIEFR